jgi:3-oxoacyl-[acyl-carrier protein] reductase
MELNLKTQLFLIGGATSGFGKSIVTALIREGANIIAVARGAEKLKDLASAAPGQIETVVCDITKPESISIIREKIGSRQLHGIVVNAGGPPAMTVMESTMADWDKAYLTLLRWKVDLVKSLLPLMIEKKYGRIVFIESAAVKEPMENLVLSNSLRLAVIGFLKTLSNEIAREGITLNALAPGTHATAAIERLVMKKTEQTGLSEDAVRDLYIKNTKVGKLGNPDDFASLAIWLLSAESRYITGQTISVDGGAVKGTMG